MTDDAGRIEDQEPPAVSKDEADAAPPKSPRLVGPDVDVKRLILVIVICLGGLIYFFWDDVRDVIQPPEIVEASVPADTLNPGHEVKVKSGALDITFSKIGAAITGLTWTNPQDKEHVEELVSQEGVPNHAFAVELPEREKSIGGAFKLVSKTEADGITTVVFRNDDFGDGLELVKTFRIHSDKPLIDLDIEINNIPIGDAINERGYGLRISNAVGLPDELSKDDPLISVRSDQIVDHHPVRRVSGTRGWPNEDERKRAGHGGVEGTPVLEWVATANKYFGLIVRPAEPMRGAMMTFTRTAKCAAAVTLLVTPKAAARISDTFHIYAGPKQYDALSGLPGRQQESIDYWYFGRLATLLLKLVHDKTVANYGLAIIIVTIIFRVLMWPVTSYNLRAMVNLKLANAKLVDVDAREPPRAEDEAKEWLEELLPLKEAGAAEPVERGHARTEWLKDQLAADTPPDELRKLIDDTGARVVWLKEMRGEWLKGARIWEKVQSRATIGAFLPMVILLPILLVLYYTLNAGYEFYRQPFALWITDISSRDPFFVLPVLMGLAMMGQFRTMSEDPQKERSWILMPVAFTIIFAFFSAGLVLFWFVDTLAGWLQVALIKRGKKRKEAAQAATGEEADAGQNAPDASTD